MTSAHLMEICPPQGNDVDYYAKCIGLVAYHVGLRLISKAEMPGELVHDLQTDSTLMKVGFEIIWSADDPRMIGHLAGLYQEICSHFSPEDLKDIGAGTLPVLPEGPVTAPSPSI